MTIGMARRQACTQLTANDFPRPTPAGGLTARATAMLSQGWRAYWERRAKRATVLILCSLDERTLRDIGISPSEIGSCVYGNKADRLRRYNESWPWRSHGGG